MLQLRSVTKRYGSLVARTNGRCYDLCPTHNARTARQRLLRREEEGAANHQRG